MIVQAIALAINLGLLCLPLWLTTAGVDRSVLAFLSGAMLLCVADLCRGKLTDECDILPASRSGRAICQTNGVAVLLCVWLALTFRQTTGDAFPVLCEVIGLSMMFAGALIRGHAIATLGETFVSRESPKGRFRTDKIYAWLRHPSECGLLMATLGGSIMMSSLVAATWWIAVLVPLSLLRTKFEERALRAEFGVEYDSYAATVGSYLPRFR